MPSFDIISEVNQVEVRNAIDQANKELSTRFDFKGSDARVEHAEKILTLFADDDFKLAQVTDIVTGKLTKRGVDIRSLKYGNVEKISGNKVKQAVTIRVGIEQELSKKIVKLIKDAKMKVQASIQGDAVRVSGAKRDDLQEAIALLSDPARYQEIVAQPGPTPADDEAAWAAEQAEAEAKDPDLPRIAVVGNVGVALPLAALRQRRLLR